MKKIGFISICALTLALGACGSSSHSLSAAERQTAELGARQYAGDKADVIGTPSGIDSDNDGYVTGDIRPRDGGEPYSIVCSYRDGATGCHRKIK